MAVNAICLAVLLYRRYYRLFPVFVVAQAFTVWQAAERLKFGESHRLWWAIGECLLLLATSGAVLEAVWASVRVMRRVWAVMIFFGLTAWAAGTVVWLALPLPANPWLRFFAGREDAFLGLGLLAFVSFWCGLATNDYWPRVARMHAGLIAALMAGHACLISWASWGNTDLNYRALEILCCVGWLINCAFLRREREAVRKALDADLRRSAGRRLVHGGYPQVPAAFRGDQIPVR